MIYFPGRPIRFQARSPLQRLHDEETDSFSSYFPNRVPFVQFRDLFHVLDLVKHDIVNIDIP